MRAFLNSTPKLRTSALEVLKCNLPVVTKPKISALASILPSMDN